ncbi:hypothetical protein EDD22DRAFT_927848 [Suillus occidentalis]|nr:hypothetical protein EDD22DRAFT_927848 [Suillus occidentalis]
MDVTRQQVQDIVAQTEGDDAVIEQFHYTSSIRFYKIDIGVSNASYLLAAADKTPDSKSLLAMQPLSLSTIRDFLSDISNNTKMPVPDLRSFDDSLARYPFHYLLLRLPSPNAQSLSSLRSSGALTPQQDALLDLKLGTFIHSMHSLQNDWFGDTFMLLLDALLCELESSGEMQKTLVEDIRRYPSRAIGSFLFEDAEVPTLVWLTGSADDVYVQISEPCGLNQEARVDIAHVLPTFDRVVWGDPMLEAFFMPPGPSKALEEGYLEGEGGTLIIFPRQRTKRIHLNVLMSYTWIPFKFFWLLHLHFDTLLPLKLISKHHHSPNSTLDTVIMRIPYLLAFMEYVFVCHPTARGRRMIGLNAIRGNGSTGDHTLCKTPNSSGLHIKYVGRLLITQERDEVIVKLSIRHPNVWMQSNLLVHTRAKPSLRLADLGLHLRRR